MDVGSREFLGGTYCVGVGREEEKVVDKCLIQTLYIQCLPLLLVSLQIKVSVTQ